MEKTHGEVRVIPAIVKREIPFNEILKKDELVSESELTTRVMKMYSLDENSANFAIIEAYRVKGLIEKNHEGYCLKGDDLSKETIAVFRSKMYYQKMEREQNRRDLIFKNNCELVSVYLRRNFQISETIDYKKTSHTLLDEISKWSGRDIPFSALDAYIKKFTVKSCEIIDGIFCYGLEPITKKQN